jgi:hypothetical protein
MTVYQCLTILELHHCHIPSAPTEKTQLTQYTADPWTNIAQQCYLLACEAWKVVQYSHLHSYLGYTTPEKGGRC